eukprot:scaffold455068_cov17-Prasinocladus_malaysianus.AAC.1
MGPFFISACGQRDVNILDTSVDTTKKHRERTDRNGVVLFSAGPFQESVSGMEGDLATSDEHTEESILPLH